MPNKFYIQTPDLGAKFYEGMARRSNLAKIEEEAKQAKLRTSAMEKNMAATDEASARARQDDFLRTFGADAMELVEVYGQGKQSFLAASQAKVRDYTDKYAETGNPIFLDAADKLQGAIKAGVNDAMTAVGGVANSYMRRVGEDPQFGQQQPTPVSWQKEDVMVDGKLTRAHYNPKTREYTDASGRPIPGESIAPRERTGQQIIVKGNEPPGQLEKGYMWVKDDQGNITGMKPIPGSSAAREEEEKEAKLSNKKAYSQKYNLVTLQDVGRAVNKIRENPEWTTGLIGVALSKLPGTVSHDVSNLLTTVKTQIGFARLQDMRDASPTGGSLGQVSDTENKMLQSALGSLEQSQTLGQLLENLSRALDIYQDIIHGTDNRPDGDMIDKLGLREHLNIVQSYGKVHGEDGSADPSSEGEQLPYDDAERSDAINWIENNQDADPDQISEIKAYYKIP